VSGDGSLGDDEAAVGSPSREATFVPPAPDDADAEADVGRTSTPDLDFISVLGGLGSAGIQETIAELGFGMRSGRGNYSLSEARQQSGWREHDDRARNDDSDR
jgi:hypothetical protein